MKSYKFFYKDHFKLGCICHGLKTYLTHKIFTTTKGQRVAVVLVSSSLQCRAPQFVHCAFWFSMQSFAKCAWSCLAFLVISLRFLLSFDKWIWLAWDCDVYFLILFLLSLYLHLQTAQIWNCEEVSREEAHLCYWNCCC